MIKNKNDTGRMLTSLRVNEMVSLSGPGVITLLETNYEGHKQIIKIAITAPKTTKIIKNKVENND